MIAKTNRESVPSKKTVVSSESLTPSRRKLLQIIRDYEYGAICDLQVENGEPVLDPPPAIQWSRRPGERLRAQRRPCDGHFVLGGNQLWLIEILKDLGDGKIAMIRFTAGQPSDVQFLTRK